MFVKSVLLSCLFLVILAIVWQSINLRCQDFPLFVCESMITAGNRTLPDVTAGHIDVSWYPQKPSPITTLNTVLYGPGVFGFIFNSSETPSTIPYSTYNWANMPHVRQQEYIQASFGYRLRYVEIIQRHHKRTPYAANTFPVELDSWDCSDTHLYSYGSSDSSQGPAQVNWQLETAVFNPFQNGGFPGNCRFPQITSAGLRDSRQHGMDLRAVYGDLLEFLPHGFDPEKVKVRVTNNVITSQVAGQLVRGLFPDLADRSLPVSVQGPNSDSLEPSYPCPAASKLRTEYGVSSNNSAWTQHLKHSSTVDLFKQLDRVSGISPNSSDWHEWFDHYYDNLSARLCHQKRLPCNPADPDKCIEKWMVEAVLRRGQHEYSFLYRDATLSLKASTAAFGVWMAELANNLRTAMSGSDAVIYRHNIAHDGSIAHLLSILQVDGMVWPGMGSEVVFELYQNKGSGNSSKESYSEHWFLRVLWAGQVLESSSPTLGRMDLIPVTTLLSYIDELVGVNASKVPALCRV